MSTVTIRITTPLRRFVAGRHEVQLPPQSVGAALKQLCREFPELEGRLVDASGALREFIQIHVGKTSLRQLGGLPTPLKAGDVVSISSPFSGG